jgi:tetratricopeptide (TPR) repeat protein
MAILGITDSLIATLLWASGKWSWDKLNDPLKKAIRDADRHYSGQGLPFPASRIESILEGRANPDKVKVFQKVECFTDSKSLATALLDFEGSSLKEEPENMENAIRFVEYFKEAFNKRLFANQKNAHRSLAALLEINLQISKDGRDRVAAEIQLIMAALKDLPQILANQVIKEMQTAKQTHETKPLQRPRRAEHFIGREKELEKLLNDLQPGKTVTLCGTGGIGKSALAAEAIWRLAPENKPPERFPDGIIYHDFYTNSRVDHALEHVVLSYNAEPNPTPTEAARRVLANRKVLILLDGAESADDLQRMLSVTDDNCGVLVTSQRRSDAVADRHDIDRLPEAEAIRLLQNWCTTAGIDDDIGQRICKLLGYLPLAVRLAGRYIRLTGERPTDYLNWLQDSPLDALDQGKRRSESVPLLIERSITKITKPSLNALFVTGLLSNAPFRGEAVAAALDIKPTEARKGLGELVSIGLLLKPKDGEGYVVSHRLVHTYTSHKYKLSSDVTERLVSYYRTLVHEQEREGLAGYMRLEPERGHLMQLSAVCEQQQLWQPLTDLAWAIENFLDLQGFRFDQLIVIKKGLLAAKKLKDKHLERVFIGNLGNVYRDLGQVEKAIEYYNQALAISRKIGHRQGEGNALGSLGIAYRLLGKYDKAIDHHNQALAISREIGDRRGEGAWLGNIGNASFSLGQYDKAIDHHNQALAISREIGSRQGEGIHLSNLGNAYRGLDQVEKAIEYYERALAIFYEIGYRQGEGNALGSLGIAYRLLGKYDKAIDHHNQALAISHEIGYRQGEGNDLGNLGIAYSDLGQVEKAIACYKQSITIHEEIKSPYAEKARLNLDKLKSEGKNKETNNIQKTQLNLEYRQEQDRRREPDEGFYYISSVGWIDRRERLRRKDDPFNF